MFLRVVNILTPVAIERSMTFAFNASSLNEQITWKGKPFDFMHCRTIEVG
jgi:hypothetical protein